MSGRDSSARAPTSSQALESPWAGAAAVAFVVIATGLVQRRVLDGFFVPDDFIMLARAQGLAEWPASAWRWLSGYVLVHATTSAFGVDPRPYHALNLACLAGCAALLGALARRRGASLPAALIAGVVFGCSRLHFTALMAASWTGEFLSLALLMATFLVFGPGRVRFAAAAGLLVAALSAKESVLLVPAALLLLPRDREGRQGERGSKVLALLAIGIAAGVGLLAAGVGTGRLRGSAYETEFGRNLADALFTLLHWVGDLATPVPDIATNPDPAAWITGLPLLVGLVAGTLALRRRAPWAAAGGAWVLLALLPVLPLVHQTHLHYLVTPWAGASLFAAGAADAWIFPRLARLQPTSWRAGQAALLAAVALSVVWGVSQDQLLSARWTARLPGGDTPTDPVLRKSEYARRLVTVTRSALGGRRACVAYFILDGTQQHLDVRTGMSAALTSVEIESLPNAVVTTLDGGLVLRTMVPNVDSVVFVRRLESSLRDFDCFYPFGDLHLQYLGRPPGAFERMATTLVYAGLPGPAVSLLDVATREWPDRPELMWAHAVALAQTGEPDRARERLRDIVRVAPTDSFATRARFALASEVPAR